MLSSTFSVITNNDRQASVGFAPEIKGCGEERAEAINESYIYDAVQENWSKKGAINSEGVAMIGG